MTQEDETPHALHREAAKIGAQAEAILQRSKNLVATAEAALTHAEKVAGTRAEKAAPHRF